MVRLRFTARLKRGTMKVGADPDQDKAWVEGRAEDLAVKKEFLRSPAIPQTLGRRNENFLTKGSASLAPARKSLTTSSPKTSPTHVPGPDERRRGWNSNRGGRSFRSLPGARFPETGRRLRFRSKRKRQARFRKSLLSLTTCRWDRLKKRPS